MSKQVEKQIEDFQRQLLADHLAQCSEAQQAFFHRLYPKGVPEDRLINAIDLCERTIKKNAANPERVQVPP